MFWKITKIWWWENLADRIEIKRKKTFSSEEDWERYTCRKDDEQTTTVKSFQISNISHFVWIFVVVFVIYLCMTVRVFVFTMEEKSSLSFSSIFIWDIRFFFLVGVDFSASTKIIFFFGELYVSAAIIKFELFFYKFIRILNTHGFK